MLALFAAQIASSRRICLIFAPFVASGRPHGGLPQTVTECTEPGRARAGAEQPSPVPVSVTGDTRTYNWSVH